MLPLHGAASKKYFFARKNRDRGILVSNALPFERIGEKLPWDELLRPEGLPGMKWLTEKSA
jgi:hypothetical protein